MDSMRCIVIAINRCQPAFLGCYGNDWLPTPAFDSLAAQSVIFERHLCDYATPRGVRRSWRTGRCRLIHQPAPQPRSTLPEILENNGVATALIVDGRSPTRRNPFSRNWGSAQWMEPDPEDGTCLMNTIQAALDRLERRRQPERFLLWLELSPLSLPWNPAEYDDEALEGLEDDELEPLFDQTEGAVDAVISARLAFTYAGMVAALDAAVDPLFARLAEPEYASALVILTSDCGLALGEHGVFGDFPIQLHEERSHLPLLMRLPAQQEAGYRVQTITQSVDLYATLLDAFGIGIPGGTEGRSLLPLAHGESIPGGDQALVAAKQKGRRLLSAHTREWSLIVAGERFGFPSGSSQGAGPWLFAKPEDRWEANDVSAQNPQVVEDLSRSLEPWLMRCGATGLQ